MKKLLLGLGSIASVVAPVAAVISCGDDSKTTPGTNGTQALDAAKQTTLKNNAATALGMTATDIDSVAKAATFGIERAGQTKTLENVVIYNIKSSVTSIVVSNGAGSTSTITTDGGGQVIIGSSSTALRTGATKHYYIATKVKSGGGDMNTLEEITDTNTLSAVKSDIIGTAFAPAAQTGINVGAVTEVSSTKATVNLVLVGGTAPTHLSKTEIEPAMTQLKALSGIATFTEITYSITDTTGTTTNYIVPITAGKANDVDAIVTAAASVTGTTGTVTTPGGGTGTGTTTATVLTAASSTVWHGLFHDGSRTKPGDKVGRSLPVAGTVLEVTVNGNTLTHTWATADDTALSGFVAATPSMEQDDVVNYLATTFATENTGNTADDIKAAFGITSASSGMHTFTTGTTGSTGGSGSTGGGTSTTPVDLTSELSKVTDITSTKVAADLQALAAGPVSGSQLGISFTLTSGITANYEIKTAYGGTGTLAVEVTLVKGADQVTNNTKTIQITPATPVDLTGLSDAAFSAIADIKTTATDADVQQAVTSTHKSVHWNMLTAARANSLFYTDTTMALPPTVTSNGKTYNIEYSMTAPSNPAKGPFSITATATSADGSPVTNNTKTFTVTTTMAVGVDHDYIEMDGTTATQINAGKTGKTIVIDRTIASLTDVSAEFIDPIVAAIVDKATNHAKQAEIDAATSILITFDYGSGPHTLTIAIAAGDATDAAKVLAAAKTGTLA